VDDGLAERLSLYALGLLEEAEAAELRAHLEDGCPVCEAELQSVTEAAAGLALSVPALTPPQTLRDRVMAAATPQVWKKWDQTKFAGLHVVRHEEGGWDTVRPGVHVKQLYVDKARDLATMLIRMDPGADYVPHRHGGPEQCLVLEGDLHDGNDVFHAGDFQCAAEGSRHGRQWTDSGCLLMIVSSLRDELL
jgi:anti-sigma factor ChrR (cupin superfamily)